MNFPIDDADELENIPSEFSNLDRTGCFGGCVGALGGPIVAIQKPSLSDCANPANYRIRKGMFAIIAQVPLERERRLVVTTVHLSAHAALPPPPLPRSSAIPAVACAMRRSTALGSTHDATSWELSQLAKDIAAGKLSEKYFLNCDDAYISG